MATKNILNFYIDYPGAITQKLSGEIETEALTPALKAKGKLWRNRIMNEQSDLVFPYAWLFFSRPAEGYGYTLADAGDLDYIKVLEPADLLHAKDCRMTAVATEETTIFGVWEV